MLTIIKVFIILFLLCLWEQGTPRQFLKQISKLSFLEIYLYHKSKNSNDSQWHSWF